MKKVLFITPYPKDSAPSQRFRFEQYLPVLKEKGYSYVEAPFMSQETWDILYQNGRFIKKGIRIIGGILKRWRLVFSIKKYDAVFIHRECKPIGLPLLDYMLCKRAKYVIYDFDDAIWMKNFSQSNKFFSFLKRYKNIQTLCKHADIVSCGNAFLEDYAKQFNQNTCILPTTIDTNGYHTKINQHANSKMVIGWTGSHSTIRYLSSIYPVIQKLNEKFDFEFRVISDHKPDISLPNLNFVQWRKSTEIEDLSQINIGIMPLEDNPWSKGKCGFKALQYMALGIPAVVSPVGVNTTIVENNVNGFLCDDEKQWEATLSKLLSEPERLKILGAKARKTIEDRYSVNANSSNFIHLFPN